jgi:hypothetical protein
MNSLLAVVSLKIIKICCHIFESDIERAIISKSNLIIGPDQT